MGKRRERSRRERDSYSSMAQSDPLVIIAPSSTLQCRYQVKRPNCEILKSWRVFSETCGNMCAFDAARHTREPVHIIGTLGRQDQNHSPYSSICFTSVMLPLTTSFMTSASHDLVLVQIL